MKNSTNYIRFYLKTINLIPKNYSSNQSGFTLIEMLVVILMVGILSAITVPSWLSFTQTRRLNVAQDQVYRSIREAQSNAKKEKRTWAACFHDDGNKVDWAVSRVPESGSLNCATVTNWQPLLAEGSRVVAINTTNTTLRQNPASSGHYRVRFRFDGALDTDDGGAANQPGKITLAVRNETNGIKRCVVVSTLLGALRNDKDAGCT